MSNIGEAQIKRLTRERLAAIKKFLPVRDAFRDHLQSQQQARAEFTADTERLFAPITTATKQVGNEVATDTTKIAARTEQTKQILKTLPGGIVSAQRQQRQR